MNAFADYTFYTGTFGGTLIPVSLFPPLALKASYKVEAATGNGASIVISAATDTDTITAIKLATCAVAELLNAFDQSDYLTRSTVASEKVGDHSVTYVDAVQSMNSRNASVNDVINDYLGSTGLLCAWA